jgi:hypothetical protein
MDSLVRMFVVLLSLDSAGALYTSLPSARICTHEVVLAGHSRGQRVHVMVHHVHWNTGHHLG